MSKKKHKDSSKDIKAFKKKILNFLKKPNYSALSQKELFAAAGISKKHVQQATRAITELVSEDKIQISKKKISLPKKGKRIITGTLSVHPRGFGFVIPDPEYTPCEKIFIGKGFMGGGVDKDHVEVEILSKKFADKGPEGLVKEVLKRNRNTILGTIFDRENEYFLAYSHILKESKIIHVNEPKKIPIKLGDIALLEVEDWSSYPRKLIANVKEVISHVKRASSDTLSAIFENDIRVEFPKAVIDEARQFPVEPTEEDLLDRLDLTKEETFTIDPDTAKDFDDALSISKDDEGHYHLIVHIADVSHYVKKGSELDQEAYARGNSTYFPGRCIPMLPEELSNGLCSLKENVLRLSVSVFMHFDPKGKLKSYDIRRSFIKSQKRFTYKQALKVIEGKVKSKHKDTLMLLVELCTILQKIRHKRGSVDLSLPEIKLTLDKDEDPNGIEIIEYDITHQLVEEFMLKANEVVAYALLSRKTDAIFRVHETPNESDYTEFQAMARLYGYKLSSEPTQQEIQKLFQGSKGSECHYQLCVAFIRSMKLAIYSEENVGHFGLSLEHYTHFTSPIRRYSDLVIHRLLFEESIPKKNLKEIAEHCSERERISFRAESAVNLLKKLRLLLKYLEEDPEKIYDAHVTKVQHYGFYFEISPIMFEGFIHVSEIGKDFYHFHEQRKALIGRATNLTIAPGIHIKVRLTDIDFITHDTFWTFEGPAKMKKKK